jgi:uncharacterized protein YlxW (UPF0749 family)
VSRRLPPRGARFVRPQWAISIGLALAVIGFVGAAQWNSSFGRQEFVTSAQRVLTAQADSLQREQEGLRQEIADAEARVREFQERDAGSRTAQERLNAELAATRLIAGTVAVRGPGLVIEIADSTRVPAEGENRNSYLVLTDDLRDIVTALWASGAEAISIGTVGDPAPAPERIVATTSIYGAGSAILVNDVRLAPPFRIEAIGPEGLHDRFLANPSFLGRVGRRIEAYGLQFASEPRDEVVLPEFVGITQFRWGAPDGAED